MGTLENTDLLTVAHQLADAARSAILPYFRSPDLQTENKDADGFDPVTLADRAAETAMRDLLQKLRPQDAILGEEFGASSGTSGLTWVLDPIDGTRGFMSGTPTWGVLIALNDENGPKLGVIDQPYIGERFVGGAGQAYVDGPQGRQDLRCRSTTLDKATLFTTFPEIGSPTERAGFEAVETRVRLTRYGMDCYAYGLVAVGQADLVVEAGLNAYDICAPIAVIEAAGGIVTDWQGQPVHKGGRVLAAGCAEIHAEALAILQDVPTE